MEECDDIINIDPVQIDTAILKRKLDGSPEELLFPCKKAAVSPPAKANVTDSLSIPLPNSAPPVKLAKAEREVLKAEKLKIRELERQRREQEKQKREQEKQKREQEKLKKVCLYCVLG